MVSENLTLVSRGLQQKIQDVTTLSYANFLIKKVQNHTASGLSFHTKQAAKVSSNQCQHTCKEKEADCLPTKHNKQKRSFLKTRVAWKAAHAETSVLEIKAFPQNISCRNHRERHHPSSIHWTIFANNNNNKSFWQPHSIQKERCKTYCGTWWISSLLGTPHSNPVTGNFFRMIARKTCTRHHASTPYARTREYDPLAHI